MSLCPTNCVRGFASVAALCPPPPPPDSLSCALVRISGIIDSRGECLACDGRARNLAVMRYTKRDCIDTPHAGKVVRSNMVWQHSLSAALCSNNHASGVWQQQQHRRRRRTARSVVSRSPIFFLYMLKQDCTLASADRN